MTMANTTSWSFSDFLVPQDTSEAPAPTILGMADSTAPVIVPVVTYWVVSAFYEAADYFDWFPTYRTYPSGEEKKRNLVSRWQTLRNVLTMHFVQIVFGFASVHLLPKAEVAPAWGNIGSAAYFGLYIKNNVPVLSDRPGLLWIAAYWSCTVWLIGRLLMAFFIFDTWAYWVHYMAHNVPRVYRTHSLYSRP
jgi:sphinganine C4-monooxygenase